MTLPNHQLVFTLTVWLSTQMLEVCPYVKKLMPLHIHDSLSTTCVPRKSEFSFGPFLRRGHFPLFLRLRNTIENP